MSKPIAFNADTATQTACSFHAAANFLEERAAQTVARLRLPGTNLTSEHVQRIVGEMAVPVVLHALAVEVLLKVRLHLAKVPFGRKHNHADLFAMLPDREKKLLAERYAKRRNPMFRSATLEEALKWSGDAFVKWRYYYEWQSVDTSVGEMLLSYEVLLEGF